MLRIHAHSVFAQRKELKMMNYIFLLICYAFSLRQAKDADQRGDANMFYTIILIGYVVLDQLLKT